MPPFVGAAGVEQDDVEAVVGAMARARTAVPLVDELQEGLGWDPDRLGEALAEANIQGLVSPWDDCPAGMAVMLSNLAADRLGLQLVGGESDATSSGRFALRWVPSKSKARPLGLAKQGGTGVIVRLDADLGGPDDPVSLDALADPREVDPAEYVAGVEWYDARRAATPGRSVAKTRDLIARGQLRFLHILGLRERWDGKQYSVEACGTCHGRPLDEMEYCCRCDRSGTDYIWGPPPKPKRRAAQGDRPKGRPRARSSKKSRKVKARRPLAAEAPSPDGGPGQSTTPMESGAA